jgi:hypothetical protein
VGKKDLHSKDTTAARAGAAGASCRTKATVHIKTPTHKHMHVHKQKAKGDMYVHQLQRLRCAAAFKAAGDAGEAEHASGGG